MSKSDMLKLLADAQVKLRIDAVREQMEEQVEEAHQLRIAAIHEVRRHAQMGAREAALSAEVRALRDAMALMASSSALQASPPPSPVPAGTAAPAPACEPLRAVVGAYLDKYPAGRQPQMFRKLQAGLELLAELHGDTPINLLRQTDLNDYFNVVEALPPKWKAQCKRRGITARQLAAQEQATTLSKKTFDDNYVVPVRLFLRWAKGNWQDLGFPVTLTTDHVEFSRDDDEGRSKQRALRPQELERLFHQVLAPCRADPDQDHKWWLPALAYYTGARINELCQVNPQTDIGVSPEGIDYVLITADGEADDGVKKSVKTGTHRYVPLHQDLVRAGFLEYVRRVKTSGAKRLFPAWNPTNGRASTQAERWFRDLLRDHGLRDDTAGARIVGFHCFRHTLLTMAAASNPPVDGGPITGHADVTKSAAQRGYEDQLILPRKVERLHAIQLWFHLHPHETAPCTAVTGLEIAGTR